MTSQSQDQNQLLVFFYSDIPSRMQTRCLSYQLSCFLLCKLADMPIPLGSCAFRGRQWESCPFIARSIFYSLEILKLSSNRFSNELSCTACGVGTQTFWVGYFPFDYIPPGLYLVVLLPSRKIAKSIFFIRPTAVFHYDSRNLGHIWLWLVIVQLTSMEKKCRKADKDGVYAPHCTNLRAGLCNRPNIRCWRLYTGWFKMFNLSSKWR